MNLEVEQKFAIKNGEAVRQRLLELGVTFDDPVTQVDRYYNHPDPARDFADTDEALRIRSVADDNVLTYKGPKLDSETKTRREVELPLHAGATHAGEMASLFELLGFRPAATVFKTRVEGHLVWQARSVTVCFDDVKDVGTFAELEVIADDADLSDAKACILTLAKELGLSSPERRSYLELLLAKK